MSKIENLEQIVSSWLSSSQSVHTFGQPSHYSSSEYFLPTLTINDSLHSNSYNRFFSLHHLPSEDLHFKQPNHQKPLNQEISKYNPETPLHLTLLPSFSPPSHFESSVPVLRNGSLSFPIEKVKKPVAVSTPTPIESTVNVPVSLASSVSASPPVAKPVINPPETRSVNPRIQFLQSELESSSPHPLTGLFPKIYGILSTHSLPLPQLIDRLSLEFSPLVSNGVYSFVISEALNLLSTSHSGFNYSNEASIQPLVTKDDKGYWNLTGLQVISPNFFRLERIFLKAYDRWYFIRTGISSIQLAAKSSPQLSPDNLKSQSSRRVRPRNGEEVDSALLNSSFVPPNPLSKPISVDKFVLPPSYLCLLWENSLLRIENPTSPYLLDLGVDSSLWYYLKIWLPPLQVSTRSKARPHPLLLMHRPSSMSLQNIVRDSSCRILKHSTASRLDLTRQFRESLWVKDDPQYSESVSRVRSLLDKIVAQPFCPISFSRKERCWTYRYQGWGKQKFESQLIPQLLSASEEKKLKKQRVKLLKRQSAALSH